MLPLRLRSLRRLNAAGKPAGQGRDKHRQHNAQQFFPCFILFSFLLFSFAVPVRSPKRNRAWAAAAFLMRFFAFCRVLTRFFAVFNAFLRIFVFCFPCGRASAGRSVLRHTYSIIIIAHFPAYSMCKLHINPAFCVFFAFFLPSFARLFTQNIGCKQHCLQIAHSFYGLFMIKFLS